MKNFLSKINDPFSLIGNLVAIVLVALFSVSVAVYSMVQIWNNYGFGEIFTIIAIFVYLVAMLSVLIMSRQKSTLSRQQGILFYIVGVLFFLASLATISYICYMIFKASLVYPAISLWGGFVSIVILTWRIAVILDYYSDFDDDYDYYYDDDNDDDEYGYEEDNAEEKDHNNLYLQFDGKIYAINHEVGTDRTVDPTEVFEEDENSD